MVYTAIRGRPMSQTAKLFINGRSQAVHLPIVFAQIPGLATEDWTKP